MLKDPEPQLENETATRTLKRNDLTNRYEKIRVISSQGVLRFTTLAESVAVLVGNIRAKDEQDV